MLHHYRIILKLTPTSCLHSQAVPSTHFLLCSSLTLSHLLVLLVTDTWPLSNFHTCVPLTFSTCCWSKGQGMMYCQYWRGAWEAFQQMEECKGLCGCLCRNVWWPWPCQLGPASQWMYLTLVQGPHTHNNFWTVVFGHYNKLVIMRARPHNVTHLLPRLPPIGFPQLHFCLVPMTHHYDLTPQSNPSDFVPMQCIDAKYYTLWFFFRNSVSYLHFLAMFSYKLYSQRTVNPIPLFFKSLPELITLLLSFCLDSLLPLCTHDFASHVTCFSHIVSRFANQVLIFLHSKLLHLSLLHQFNAFLHVCDST